MLLLLMSEKRKANKHKRSIWTRRWIERREKHGAYHILVRNRKVNKQQLTNQHSAFSATCCTDRAGCYSVLGCATCCATQQQPMTDVQQKSRNKVVQQKSTGVIRVSWINSLCLDYVTRPKWAQTGVKKAALLWHIILELMPEFIYLVHEFEKISW